MKKIGVLTFHKAINNGAVLQAYALTKAFNEVNCDARYIDYTAIKIKNDYYIKPLFKRRSIKSIGVYFLFDLNIGATHRKFKEFIERYVPVEECQLNEDVIKRKFDALVSGGDQIWNLKLTGNDTTYYLDFAKGIEKYSYGTSFGTAQFSSDETKLIRKLLSDYNQLNVREMSAKNYIETFIGRECNVVPDPVFLLSKYEWIEQLQLLTAPIKKDYILFFELHENEMMRSCALRLAKENKCKIYRITNDFFKVSGMKNVKRTGPIEFLKYILNARIVVTDSFHATAFALIFNRPLCIGLKQGEFAQLNTRIDNLVNTFNIKSQVITDEFHYGEINYDAVNRILNIEQEKGIAVLKEIACK